MTRTAPLPALAVVLLLSACGDGDDRGAPGGVTQSEAAALNDAAAMLDQNALAADALANTTEDR